MNQTQEFTQKALTRLQSEHSKWKAIEQLGFEKSGYEESLTDLLEESIALLLSNGDTEKFESVLEDVIWWVYDKEDKLVQWGQESNVDVSQAKVFADWLVESYEGCGGKWV